MLVFIISKVLKKKKKINKINAQELRLKGNGMFIVFEM